jgi:hypothetical protein
MTVAGSSPGAPMTQHAPQPADRDSRAFSLWLSAAFFADESTPPAFDESMSVALIATVVIVDFSLHPPG